MVIRFIALLIALVIAPVLAAAEDRQIEFADLAWRVRRTRLPEGPGPNLFSDSRRTVWVDDSGNLHLRLWEQNDSWYAAEVTSVASFGYGTYVFQIVGTIDQFDPSVILGLFTYDDAPDQYHREIDIEFGRFGEPSREPGQFAVQPFHAKDHRHLFLLDLEGNHTTHAFSWNPDRLQFVSIHGHVDDPFAAATTSADRVIASWEYEGDDVPTPACERVHINLWLYEGREASRDHEVVVAGFSFAASEAEETAR